MRANEEKENELIKKLVSEIMYVTTVFLIKNLDEWKKLGVKAMFDVTVSAALTYLMKSITAGINEHQNAGDKEIIVEEIKRLKQIILDKFEKVLESKEPWDL